MISVKNLIKIAEGGFLSLLAILAFHLGIDGVQNLIEKVGVYDNQIFAFVL